MLIKFLVLISLFLNTKFCFANEILNISDQNKIIFSYNEKNYSIKLKHNGIEKNLKLLDHIDINNIPNEIGIIGSIDEKYAVIVKIKHPIRASSSQCGAGVEATLSIVDLSIDNPHEIYTILVASCGYSIELANSEDEHNIKIGDYFSWNKDSILIDKKEKRIDIKWGYNPKKEDIAETILKINPDGKVTEVDRK